MLGRPDPKSFTRFLASIGVFLCVAAFVGPALVIHDTSLLRISTRALHSYTAVAQRELMRRQRLSTHAAEIAPYAGAVLLVLGVGLIIYSAPRLRRQEEADERRSSVELAKLMREIEPQDESDREQSLLADVADELAPTTSVPQADVTPVPTPDPRGMMHRASEIEERVLARIAEIAPVDERRFEPRIRLPGSSALLLDGLLASRSGRDRDVLIEIKLAGRSLRQNLRNRIDEALGLRARYTKRTHRDCVVWLIFVLDTDGEVDAARRVRDAAAEFDGEIVVTVVREDQIDELGLPGF